MLECSDKTFYIGIAKDLSKRILEHNTSPKGAKYTRTRRPVLLKYSEVFPSRSEAQKREYELKQLTRLEKEKLVS